MATSGQYNWNLDLDQVILRAFQEPNIYGKDDVFANINANDVSFAKDKLNGLLKLWAADGIKPSKRIRAYLFPNTSGNTYALGNVSTGAHCTSNYFSTVISTAAVLNATTLIVSDTSGMNANDHIGIELDNNTRQWTTIQSITDSTHVVISTGITSTAAVNNTVITYTTKINKPLDVIYGTSLDLKNQNNEVTLLPLSHDEYNKLPIKTTPGRPNNYYFDSVLTNATPHTSNLFLYPTPQNVYQIITIVYEDMIQDMVNDTDDIDLPQEWLYPVWFNLSAELCVPYGKLEELKYIQAKADKFYSILKAHASDKTPLRIRVSKRP